MRVGQTKRVTFIITSLLGTCLAHPLPPGDGFKHESALPGISKQGKGDVQSEDYISDDLRSPTNQTDHGNFIVIIQTWSDYIGREAEGGENETRARNTSEELLFSRKKRSEDVHDDSDAYSTGDNFEHNPTNLTQPEWSGTVTSSGYYSGNESHSYPSSSVEYNNTNGSRSTDDVFSAAEEYPDQTYYSEEQEEAVYENTTNAFDSTDKESKQLSTREINEYYIDQEEDYPQTPEDLEEKASDEQTEESYETSEEKYDERRKRNVKNHEYGDIETGISPKDNNFSSIKHTSESYNEETTTKMSEYNENLTTKHESMNTTRSDNKETTKTFVYKRSLDKDEFTEDMSNKSTYENHEITSKYTKTESYMNQAAMMSGPKGNMNNEPKEDEFSTTMLERRNMSSVENKTESVKNETSSERLVYKRSIDNKDTEEEEDTTAITTSETTNGSRMDVTTEVYNKKQ